MRSRRTVNCNALASARRVVAHKAVIRSKVRCVASLCAPRCSPRFRLHLARATTTPWAPRLSACVWIGYEYYYSAARLLYIGYTHSQGNTWCSLTRELAAVSRMISRPEVRGNRDSSPTYHRRGFHVQTVKRRVIDVTQ